MGSLPFQNDTDTDNKAVLSSFAKVKRDLDPAFSYMIFEKDAQSYGDTQFKKIDPLVSRLKEGLVKQEVHYDQAAGRVLIVAKLDLKDTDKIINEFLNVILQKNINFYVYGIRPKK